MDHVLTCPTQEAHKAESPSSSLFVEMEIFKVAQSQESFKCLHGLIWTCGGSQSQVFKVSNDKCLLTFFKMFHLCDTYWLTIIWFVYWYFTLNGFITISNLNDHRQDRESWKCKQFHINFSGSLFDQSPTSICFDWRFTTDVRCESFICWCCILKTWWCRWRSAWASLRTAWVPCPPLHTLCWHSHHLHRRNCKSRNRFRLL